MFSFLKWFKKDSGALNEHLGPVTSVTDTTSHSHSLFRVVYDHLPFGPDSIDTYRGKVIRSSVETIGFNNISIVNSKPITSFGGYFKKFFDMIINDRFVNKKYKVFRAISSACDKGIHWDGLEYRLAKIMEKHKYGPVFTFRVTDIIFVVAPIGDPLNEVLELLDNLSSSVYELKGTDLETDNNILDNKPVFVNLYGFNIIKPITQQHNFDLSFKCISETTILKHNTFNWLERYSNTNLIDDFDGPIKCDNWVHFRGKHPYDCNFESKIESFIHRVFTQFDITYLIRIGDDMFSDIFICMPPKDVSKLLDEHKEILLDLFPDFDSRGVITSFDTNIYYDNYQNLEVTIYDKESFDS